MIRALSAISITANVIGTLVVVGLVVVLNYDVVARGVFSAPFLGAVEVVQFSMVLIVFLQLPDVVRTDRLTRSDGFLLVIGQGRPGLEVLMRRLADGISAVMMGLITVAMWPEFISAWQSADYFGVPGVFTAPWWPVKLTIVFGAGLSTLIFVAKTIKPNTRRHADTPSTDTSV